MKRSRRRRFRVNPEPTPCLQGAAGTTAAQEAPSLPTVVASVFTRLRLGQRASVLRHLLLPIGPMALAVLGGGVFAKYAAQARWSGMSFALEDAARVTSSQVYELARYVEQSNPLLLQQVLAGLARDATTMAALGASVAAIVIQQVANRTAGAAAALPRQPG